MWGWVAVGLGKTVAREVAGGRRREGVATERATSPRPVSFVVPAWLGAGAGFFLAGALLAIAAQLLRLSNGRATAGEVTSASLTSALVCALPGVALAVWGTVVARKKRRLRDVQALASRPGGVALVELASKLGVSLAVARTLGEEAIRDEHVLGAIDEHGHLTARVP